MWGALNGQIRITRVGLPFGALRSIKEWKTIHDATLEQEGDAVLNILGNHSSDDLKDPEIGSDNVFLKPTHPLPVGDKDEEESKEQNAQDILTPFYTGTDDSEESAAVANATMED